MAGNPKDARADRRDAEEAPVKAERPSGVTLPPQAAQLKRTVSSTQLLASEILAQLRQKKSSRPPAPLESSEEKKDNE